MSKDNKEQGDWSTRTCALTSPLATYPKAAGLKTCCKERKAATAADPSDAVAAFHCQAANGLVIFSDVNRA